MRCRAHTSAPWGSKVRCEWQAGHRSNHACGTGPSEVVWTDASAIYPHEPISANEPDHDQVKAPEHYRFPNGAEVKDITQWLTFFRGSAVKYLCRAGRKAGVDELVDLRKARECIDNEIQRLEAAQ